eukprot:scpid102653/ scgid24634/ 
MFFKNQLFGRGGNNADTASAAEEDVPVDGMPNTPAAACVAATKPSPIADDADIEPGKKPCREATRHGSSQSSADVYMYVSMQGKLAQAEEESQRRRMEFEQKTEEDRRKW